MLNLIKFIITLAFLILGASFAVINNSPVALDLYFIQTELPLSLVMLLTLGAGIILGGFFSLFFFFRLKKENADLRKQKQLVQQEVNNLRSMPLSGR